MARPERHDVDYFPFIVKDGRTLFILESKYDCKGTGFFTNLLRFLSQQPDHHYSIKDESDKMFFFSKMKCDEESGMDIAKHNGQDWKDSQNTMGRNTELLLLKIF